MSARKSDWRRDSQREEAKQTMKYLGSGLNALGFVCFLGNVYGRLDLHWVFACVLLSFTSLVFYLAFPQYFSLLGLERFKNRVGNRTKVVQLEIAVTFPVLVLLIRSLRDFEIIGWTPLMYYAIAGGLAISLIIYLFSREHRENTDLLITTFLVSVLISGAIAVQINHHADTEYSVPEKYTVTELDRDGSQRARLWYCTVENETGHELSLPISRAEYYAMELGEQVSVYHGVGALKIEYAYLLG